MTEEIDAAFATLANLDPGLKAILEAQTKRKRNRRRNPGQHRRAAADAARSKATWDIPRQILDALAAIATAESVSKSNLVAEFLARAVNAYHKGKIELSGQKQPGRSLRWDWELVITSLEVKGETQC